MIIEYTWEAEDIKVGIRLRSAEATDKNPTHMIGSRTCSHALQFCLIRLDDGFVDGWYARESLVAELNRVGFKPVLAHLKGDV